MSLSNLDPEPDPARCQLLGPTALIVQALMGALVVTSLIAKRQFEHCKRPWKIWIWDVGKQLVGQGVIHGLNLLISYLVAQAASHNPCSLYFLNVLIDTTIGVLIFFFALKGFTWLCIKHVAREGFVSGKYGHPPNPVFWWRQLLPYLGSIIVMKLLVLLPLTLPHISTFFLSLGQSLLEYLSPDAQVIFTMSIFPLLMNMIQFCLIDQIVKASKDKDDRDDDDEGYHRVPTREADIEARTGGLTVGETRRRGSVIRPPTSRTLSSSSAPTSLVMPSSPLLSPAGSRRDKYGSTSPSPNLGSPNRSDVFWAALARSASPSDSVSSDQPDGLFGSRLAPGQHVRSGAPSPDSFRPALQSSGELQNITDDLPCSATFTSVSRLSDEAGQQARQSLSPARERMLPRLHGEQGELGLTEVER